MSKLKKLFECQECGTSKSQWLGQCPDCNAWNSLVEIPSLPKTHSFKKVTSLTKGYTGLLDHEIKSFSEITAQEVSKTSIGIQELDRVLGGGIVKGSAILLGGDPGIGKSTLLLHALATYSLQNHVSNELLLYVTGEESLEQIVLRAQRLKLNSDSIKLLASNCIETILDQSIKAKPQILVIDSIQTLCSLELSGAPGSVSQVRECAARLVQFAKTTGTSVFLIGHVTKEGAIAGPRVLEHMVDTVLYFEGNADNKFRAIRAVKNRFGAVNELGIFTMTDKGLKEVTNPSAIFLQSISRSPGSVVTVTWEGSRPLLVEVQALVDTSHLGNPRRISVGIDHARLVMGLAILNKHGGIPTYDQDVFVNVVSGIKISETAVDLTIVCAIVSSLRNQIIPEDIIIFGEMGLGGELRPIQNAQQRLQEAKKHGFKKAILPKANLPKGQFPGLEIIVAEKLEEVLQALRNL